MASPIVTNTLIVDSGGIINAIALNGKAEKYVTIPEVFDEIKDEQSRKRMAQLPFDLDVRQPSDAALAAVSTFARTTGDLKFLSKVDVHVLALTYMVAAEARGWADLAEDITTRLRRITDKAAKIAIPGAPAPQPAPSASTAAAPGASGAQPPAAGTRSAPKAWGKPAKASGKKPTFAQLLASATAEEGDGGDAPAPAAAEPPSAGRVRFAEPTPEVPDFGQDAFPTLRPAAGTAEAAALPQRMAPPSWPPPGSEGQRRPVGTSILALVAQDTARKAVSAALSTIRAQYPEPEPEPEPEPVGGDSAPHAGGAASGGGAAASRSHILSHGVAQGSTVRHVKAGEEDDGPAWVTPGNLAAVLSSGASFGAGKRGGGDPVPVSPVACVTVDFTMQNVLLGMGLRVLAADGRRVKRSKQFVLKCDSCFHVTREMDRLFCPACGHATLARLGVTVDGKGRSHYHYSKHRRVNTRGQVYSYGKPTGGRGGDLLLSEDQLMFGTWAGKARKKERHESMWADGAEMMHSVKRAGFGGGWTKPTAGGSATSAPDGLGVRGNKNIVVGKKGNPNARKGRERRGAKKKNKKR